MMAAQLSLTGVRLPRNSEFARQQLERLVRERLAGRRIDVVAFVEELLAITTQVGEISCGRVADSALYFRLADNEPFEVALDANRGKLRMICARLAVLCQECGDPIMLYGGEGTIYRTAKADSLEGETAPILYFLVWKARWSNTPDKHEFTLSVAR